MRVAHFLPSFPVASQAFVLSQITGLIDLGCEVDLFAHSPGSLDHVHPDVARYGLLDRVRYWAPASGRLRRTARFVRKVSGEGRGATAELLASLVPRHGRVALGAALLDAEIPELREDRYDMFHCHFGNIADVPVLLRDALELKAPVVTTFYGHDVTRHPRQRGIDCYRWLFRRGDHFLALSDDMRTRLAALGCAREWSSVHHLGVRSDEIEFRPRRLAPGHPTRLACAARLVEKKGLEYAIRAVAILRERKLDVELDVVGDGPLREPLEALVGSLELGDRVRLRGPVSQPEAVRLIETCHLFVHPSVEASDGDQEGTPTAILEAMASGATVVATRHAGIPEQIEEGVSGLLVAERDAGALATAIAALVDRPARWAELARVARRRVELEFDSTRQAERLLGIYRRAIDAR